jgi:hypothetical protein
MSIRYKNRRFKKKSNSDNEDEIPKASVIFSQLSWLITRKYFIIFCSELEVKVTLSTEVMIDFEARNRL